MALSDASHSVLVNELVLLPDSQLRVRSASDFSFLVSACEGVWPVLSLTVISSNYGQRARYC